MIEVGQRLVDSGTQSAQLGDQLRLHVFETGEGLAFDIVEQAHAQRLAIEVQRQQLLAGRGTDHSRHGQPAFAQETQGRMLGL
ncbi:hypothetical protein D3C85_1806560 [compost metagenome]